MPISFLEKFVVHPEPLVADFSLALSQRYDLFMFGLLYLRDVSTHKGMTYAARRSLEQVSKSRSRKTKMLEHSRLSCGVPHNEPHFH